MEISAGKMNRRLWDIWRAAAALDGRAAAGQGDGSRATATGRDGRQQGATTGSVARRQGGDRPGLIARRRQDDDWA